MSRKPTRPGYQHDISIIGNLPQRLKKKIADKAKVDGLENCCFSDAVANVDEINDAVNIETTVQGEVPRVDFFLKYDSAHAVPCNIGTAKKLVERNELEAVERSIPGILRLNNVKSEKHIAKKQREDQPNAVIPGIIRLNAANTENVAGKGEERIRSHKVLKPKNAQRNDMQMSVLPLSPARSFTAKKYPTWFDDPQIESFCANLKQLYDTFTGLMQQNAVQQHWSYFNETRVQLLFIFKQIVLQHLKFCCEMKCDSLFWKLLFYNVREFLKFTTKALDGTNDDPLIELIDDGIAFYMDLLKCLKIKYLKFEEKLKATNSSNCSVITMKTITTTQKHDKFEVIAKVVAQKLLINLGDLCRYKALHLKSNDLSEAANYYREAQLLIPTNGIPYNQLAIVAIHDRKKFEAIYLHMRSLMSSNAIHSAKESLLVLLDEIRKKFEKTEPKISPLHQYKHVNNASGSDSSGKVISPLRKEVWIHPDGVRRLHRTSIDGRRSRLSKPAKNIEMRLDEMSNEDLLHRFISIYLYMIGKLYTGIGMETIQTHQTKLLTQLCALLKKDVTPILITRSKLLKIVALNIFVLHHNIQQARREIRYFTFTFCNQMFGVFLQTCNQLFKTFENDTSNEKLEKRKRFKDLNTLLQFVKIYTDYLSLNVDIWEPIRKEEQYFVDPWTELQNLFEQLEMISTENQEKFTVDTSSKEKDMPSEDVILEEDAFLYGFTPLSTLQPKYYNANQFYASELLQFFTRVSSIKRFQASFLDFSARLQNDENVADSSFVLEELDGDIKTALETLHKNAVSDVSGTEIRRNKSLNDLKTLQTPVATSTTTIAVMENDSDATSTVTTKDNQLAHLTKLKKELEQQTNAKRSYHTKLEEILNYVDTKVYIEVRPKYLMPDTNCFIDCLEDFEQLLKDYKRYILVIPLTVVRELDGLSKGIKPESRPHFMQKHRIHHFDDVSTCAKRSLDFIKSTKQNVKCVTSKGSIINASLFALVEEEYMSNDDRILATAVALSKTMCLETSKDDKCFIQTQLVLITTDRNLRVKALSRNLAVSELDEFLLWARDCNST